MRAHWNCSRRLNVRWCCSAKARRTLKPTTEIRTFIESTGIPFLPMSMAKGLLPDNHAQSAAAARSFAIGQADVVLVVGRAPELASFARQGSALEREHEAHPDRHRGQGDGQQPRDRGSRRRRHQVRLRKLQRRARAGPGQTRQEWIDDITSRKHYNVEKMAKRLAAEPSPMNFSSALRAVRDASPDTPTCTSSTRARTRSTSGATFST